MSYPHPYIRNIEPYGQVLNGCGLASILMLLNVPQNKEIENFLNKMWDLLKPLYANSTFKKKEYQWAIVLQYVLLKCLGYNKKEQIYHFLDQRLNYAYEDARIINKFSQEKNREELLRQQKHDQASLYLHYTELDDYVTPLILMKNLHTMKTDAELKILAELFNYKFIYLRSEDMTGAIYFTDKQLKRRIPQSAKTKWRKLENWANQPDKIILYGQSHHWLAVRGIYREFQKQSKNPLNHESTQNNIKSKKIKEQFVKPSAESSFDNSKELLINSLHQTSKKSTLKQIQEIFELERNETTEWKSKEMTLAVNDPAFREKTKFKFTDLSSTDRFYVFQKRKNENYSIFEDIIQYTEADIEKEKIIWKSYLRAKNESISKNLQKDNPKNKTEKN